MTIRSDNAISCKLAVIDLKMSYGATSNQKPLGKTVISIDSGMCGPYLKIVLKSTSFSA